METKVLQVFYGKDCLPYKDKERSVHFPIVGAAIQGASNTTKIRFYYDKLDELNESTFVAVSKLPNGKIGSKILENYYDEELQEHYALLELDSFYTQAKGDVYISLQGYFGGVQVDYDETSEIYTIIGTPNIQATGSIKLAINYATQFVGNGETENVNFQRIIADLSTKLGIRSKSIYVSSLPPIGESDTFYVVRNDSDNPELANIYIWNETTKHYIWVGDNTLILIGYYTKEEGDAFEEEINAKVQSITNGSPRGVYSTLSDLQTADPDHDYIYVVLATGHWYYWNGTLWADGGSYLTGPYDDEIKNSTNAVQNRAISDLYNVDYGTNLLDEENITDGKYINPATGILYDNASYHTTDYIQVSEGQKISAQSGYKHASTLNFVCAFDDNKNVLPSAGGSYVSNYYTVPSGVSYIRISYEGVFSAIFVGEGSTFIVPYHKPYYILKNTSLDNQLHETKELLNCFDKVYGNNLFNKEKITENYFIDNTGQLGSNSSYFYTEPIPIEEGKTLSFNETARFVCALDENGNCLTSYGTESVASYTSASGSGVRYLVLTFYSSVDIDALIVNEGTAPLPYEPYVNPYYVLKKTGQNVSFSELDFAEMQNYFDKDDPDVKIGYYLWQGNLNSNSSYFVTGFMEVETETTYALADEVGNNARFVECYDAEKHYISGTATEYANTITTTATTRFVRATFYVAGYNTACVVKGSMRQVGLKHEKLIPGQLISCNRELLAFLPKHFYCAVGTTLEIYNDQVMPSASKYHFRWICRIGKPLNRKFTITGTSGNVGNYDLTLQVFDDTGASLFTFDATLHIVNPLSTQKSIVPIGDSLTNNKYWLKYVNVDLSNGNIQYVGTRGATTGQKQEGRSGWTAADYLSDTDYSYEQPTTPNPFWDDALERFSWDYYKTTYNIDPDAIQIWLGTNDLIGGDYKGFADNIKTMLEYIRDDDATIPVFICLTILPAEQNGIGAQTSSDGFQSDIGRWQYGWWSTIIQGVKYLESQLIALNDSNLHIIPLVCSHDSKYNFGNVETPVNPHTPNITEPMPVEGVHPQQNGYEQIGDILYGAYSAKLGN